VLPGVVRLQTSNAAQVAQQLASGDELHHEVEIAGVLAEALHMDLGYGHDTMKGWLRVARIWL
jgi:hypothetical protein